MRLFESGLRGRWRASASFCRRTFPGSSAGSPPRERLVRELTPVRLPSLESFKLFQPPPDHAGPQAPQFDGAPGAGADRGGRRVQVPQGGQKGRGEGRRRAGAPPPRRRLRPRPRRARVAARVVARRARGARRDGPAAAGGARRRGARGRRGRAGVSLRGASDELLQAAMEVCQQKQAEEGRATSCRRWRAVPRASPRSPARRAAAEVAGENAQLRAREAVLQQRLAELRDAQRSWEAVAQVRNSHAIRTHKHARARRGAARRGAARARTGRGARGARAGRGRGLHSASV